MKPSRAGITLFEGDVTEFDGKVTQPPALQIAMWEGLQFDWDYESAENIVVLYTSHWGKYSTPALHIPLIEAEAKLIHNHQEKGGWGYYDLQIEENDDRAVLHMSFMNESQVETGFLWIIDKRRRAKVRKAINRFLDYGSQLPLK